MCSENTLKSKVKKEKNVTRVSLDTTVERRFYLLFGKQNFVLEKSEKYFLYYLRAVLYAKVRIFMLGVLINSRCVNNSQLSITALFTTIIFFFFLINFFFSFLT